MDNNYEDYDLKKHLSASLSGVDVTHLVNLGEENN